mmetsp:Transcript_55916/g.109447  ORF Transcript_55916/g.109447 Transcript_55916/m.109447 type:complete len:443 (+) Transcript_55916:411-1739(+)
MSASFRWKCSSDSSERRLRFGRLRVFKKVSFDSLKTWKTCPCSGPHTPATSNFLRNPNCPLSIPFASSLKHSHSPGSNPYPVWILSSNVFGFAPVSPRSSKTRLKKSLSLDGDRSRASVNEWMDGKRPYHRATTSSLPVCILRCRCSSAGHSSDRSAARKSETAWGSHPPLSLIITFRFFRRGTHSTRRTSPKSPNPEPPAIPFPCKSRLSKFGRSPLPRTDAGSATSDPPRRQSLNSSSRRRGTEATQSTSEQRTSNPSIPSRLLDRFSVSICGNPVSLIASQNIFSTSFSSLTFSRSSFLREHTIPSLIAFVRIWKSSKPKLGPKGLPFKDKLSRDARRRGRSLGSSLALMLFSSKMKLFSSGVLFRPILAAFSLSRNPTSKGSNPPRTHMEPNFTSSTALSCRQSRKKNIFLTEMLNFPERSRNRGRWMPTFPWAFFLP